MIQLVFIKVTSELRQEQHVHSGMDDKERQGFLFIIHAFGSACSSGIYGIAILCIASHHESNLFVPGHATGAGSPTELFDVFIGITEVAFFQQKGQNPSQDTNTVQCLIKVNVVGRFDDLTELRRGLRKERREVLETFVSQSSRRGRGDKFKDFFGAAGDLPQFVPKVGIVRTDIDFDESRDGLSKLFARGGGSHDLYNNRCVCLKDDPRLY
mmetsp:Transcript_26616/g.49714  ORF Transcript_26616/g.49714 Transcript_26616/m.49714 type:complete len:212 (-) Transcript_26616:82-717(-)